MKIPPPAHRWSVSVSKAIEIQRELASRVRHMPLARPPRYVAGVDAAFTRDERYCVAAAVLWDVRRREMVEERFARRVLTFPYVPGLLSFREAPAVLAALRKIRGTVDAVLCDAHGLAHPRRFGLACHVGLLCERPTIGCAKSILVGEHAALGFRRGSRAELLHRGDVVGAALRTRDGVRPVYVSVGHRIDPIGAETVVLDCAVRFRLPEPTRLADHLVGRARLT